MANYKLVSYPFVDMGLLPLYLEAPDDLRTGGYRIPLATPSGYKSTPQYSPVDLLVAGIEAFDYDFKVTNLDKFFSSRQRPMSEYKVFVTYLQVDPEDINSNSNGNEILRTESIAQIKSRIYSENNYNLLNTMRQNAPFTFKYINIK